MDVVFQCSHCGQGLVADVAGKGKIISCPKCSRAVIVPDPNQLTPPVPTAVPSATTTKPGSPATRKTVIRLPSPDAAKDEKADEKKEKEEAEVAAASTADWHILSVIVGWICVVVGVLLAILVPKAVLAFIPFFLGAFMMGVMLLVSGRVLHGIVLLLCTCIPPPLLMRTNIWDHIAPPRQTRTATSSSAQQKLVFDASGKTKLVFAQDEAASSVQPAAPRSTEKITLPPRKKKERAPRPESDLSAPTNTEPAARPPPKDPYGDLIENAENIPALVPEDVLAQSYPVRSVEFRYQDPSSAVSLSPDDPAPVADMPFVLYAEVGEKTPPYHCTGRMGNDRALTIDENWDSDPHSGKTCMKVSYADISDWVQAVWQNPGNNWGDVPGGYDLSKATKLTFWAKGDAGGERIELGIGMSQSSTAVAHDSFKDSSTFRLQSKWKKYSIPIEKFDRTRIISGLILRLEGQEKPTVFYLDDIQYEP